jgi:hypothetical protein
MGPAGRAALRGWAGEPGVGVDGRLRPSREVAHRGLPCHRRRKVSGRTWLATAVLLVATFMELMDMTMANVAVPVIQQDLATSDGQVQWSVFPA